jgi:NAD+ diphosphatase
MGSRFPELPALPNDDSMLTRKFGREVANYFSGSPLNRLSFLRTDHGFLRSAFSHPSARFMLVDSLAPCVTQEKPPRLAFATIDEVAPLTGKDPFAKDEADMIKEYDSGETHTLILFMGIDEHKKLNVSDVKDGLEYKGYKGSPYFAVDITPKGNAADIAKKIAEEAKAKGFTFDTNPRAMRLSSEEGKLRRDLLSAEMRLTPLQPRCTARPARSSNGTCATPSALSAASPRSPSMQAPSASARRRISRVAAAAPARATGCRARRAARSPT